MKHALLFVAILLLVSVGSLCAQVLPKPSGQNRIGTTIIQLTDKTRPDLLDSGKRREMMVQFWYPADPAAKGSTATYLSAPALIDALLKDQYDGQTPEVIGALKGVQVNAILDAPISAKGAAYPLLIFSHGAGEPRSNYTSFIEDLASNGFIVVSIDHPYGGYSVLTNGRVTSTNDDPRGGTPEGAEALTIEWAEDASYILDRLWSRTESLPKLVKQIVGRIKADTVGMLGHSLGGAAALEACRVDPRFKACADLDGAPFGKVKIDGVQRPTLIMRSGPIYSDADLAKRGRTREQWDKMGADGKLMWASINPKEKGIPLYNVKVQGAGHMTYSDSPFTMPDTITRFGGKIIDTRLGYEIISAYIRDFFNKYLKREPAKMLDKAASPYAEVIIEKFGA